MLLLCDNTIVPPLKIIFDTILTSEMFPDVWKMANVLPIFEKEYKQLVKNYRPISLLPIIMAKVFERLLFRTFYNYFKSNNLITKNNPDFPQVTPPPTN